MVPKQDWSKGGIGSWPEAKSEGVLNVSNSKQQKPGLGLTNCGVEMQKERKGG